MCPEFTKWSSEVFGFVLFIVYNKIEIIIHQTDGYFYFSGTCNTAADYGPRVIHGLFVALALTLALVL
jgi:hypothetical protein